MGKNVRKEDLMFSSNLTFHQNYNFEKKIGTNVSGVVYVILKSVWVGSSFFGGEGGNEDLQIFNGDKQLCS